MRLLLRLTASLAILAPTIALAQEGPAAPAGGIEEIIVTGRAQKLYRAGETTTGKLPSIPLESSQSIQVINAELIRDQGARDAQDLYRNISGVSVFSYAGVTARGFRQEEIFFDGLRGDPYAGFSVPQLFNVERVEFLKGPAGMLYGPGAPGGLFNYVTKKPSARFAATASAVVGTGDRYGASAEITGALPLEGSAGRLGAFYEDRDLARFNAGSETLILDGGLSLDLDFADLLLQATRYEQNLDGNRLRGVPTDDDGNFLTDRRWNHNEPGDYLDLVSNVASARLEGMIGTSVTWDAALRFIDAEEEQQYHEPRGLIDTDGDGAVDTTRREFRDQMRMEQSWSFGANAVWSADFGAVQNRLLGGYEYFTGENDFRGRARRFGPVPDLSLFDPVYGLADPATYDLPAFNRSLSEEERHGVYLLEEATIGRFIATAGIRFDSFTDEADGVSFEDEALTFRTGLIYRVRDDISLFAQWAESFEPQDAGSQGADVGGPFDPTEGEIIEAGIKAELMDGRIQASAAVYEITRSNILQTDPRGDVGGDGRDDLVAFGEITSRGAEFDLAADLTDDWVLTLAYGYNDTKITETTGQTSITNSVGDRFANAPEHQLGFWTRYQIPEWNLAFALGGDYVSDRLSLSGQTVKSYTVFDASVMYDIGPWSVLLRIDNLFDKTYAASGFIDRTGHFPGEPRTIFLELSRTW